MASREGQGLQIAVILFAMLTILLAVTTYVFYAQTGTLASDKKRAEEATTQANATAKRANYQMLALQMMMGLENVDQAQVDAAALGIDAPVVEKVKKWRDDFSRDMTLFGENAGAEGAKNYRTLPMYLLGEINKKNSSVVAANSIADGYKKQKDTEVATERDRVKQAESARDTASADLEKERQAFNSDRTKLTQDKEKLAGDLEKKDKVAKKQSEDQAAKIASISSQVSNLLGLTEAQKSRINDLTKETGLTLENPDGKIVWVDQKQQLVWINLGYADGLNRQTTFSVFDQDQTSIYDKSKLGLAQNAASAEDGGTKKNKLASKGRIEVVRVVSEHQAECRILEDSPSKPMLPGDWIQTPIWSPGQVTHFALVGFMDIDGDGQNDRDLVRNIIKLNGGVIDAELLDNGTRLPGKMSVNTRYIVSGERPNEKTSADADRGGKYLKEYNKLMQEKNEFGVDEISVRELLDQMGWRAEERTISIGKGGTGAFRKRTPGKKDAPAPAAGTRPAPPPAADDGAPAEDGAMPAEDAPAAPATSGEDPFGGS